MGHIPYQGRLGALQSAGRPYEPRTTNHEPLATNHEPLISQPAADVVFGIFDGRTQEGQALAEFGRRAESVDVFQAVTDAAAFMGAERINRLIREVVAFQERPQGHGHGAAPVGIAQEDDVVIIDAVDIPFQDRPGVVGLFFPGDLDDFLIVIGIDRSRADVEEFATRE